MSHPALLRRPLALDVLLLLALGTIALLGFHSTYVGQTFLIAGIAGLVLGAAIALLAHRLGQPVVVLAVLTVAVFFLLGGVVALHSLGGTAVLPVPDTLNTLADNSVHGWKKLLTTLPPVDGGPLLTLPYLLGLVCGAAGTTLAARVRLAIAPVVAPTVLLALVILLGVQSPSGVALQAAAFAALAIAWVVIRGRRLRTLRTGGRRLARRTTASVLCLGAAAVGFAAGPHLPGLKDDRVVLRSHVEPPFNVGQYPSPLAGFRIYTKGYQTSDPQRRLYDRPLLEVTGLPAGTRLRFATLDSYDGDVWRAANDAGLGGGAADTFQKVGSTIENPAASTGSTPGRRVAGTVTVEKGFSGVWVPTAGALTGVRFSRPDAETGSDVFRYNLATSTGVLPSGLKPGDSYRFSAVLPDDALGKSTTAWSGGTNGAADAAARFQSLAAELAGGGQSPMEQVLAVAARLKADGTYTDGEPPNEQYPAGHSLRRLTDFTAKGSQLAGDDEQYAAMMAILANQLGVPARVVLGAVPESAGSGRAVVRGKDVHAWVELRAGDGSWRTLEWDRFMSTKKPHQRSPQSEQLVEGKVVPPPAPVRPPSTTGDPLDDSVNQKAHSHTSDDDAHGLPGYVRALLLYAGGPVLVVVLLGALIVGVKAWRRRRRRTAGPPTRRLVLGWREILDHARDFGHRAPPGATRREQAAVLSTHRGLARIPALALATDVTMFGAQPPDEQSAAAYWREVEALRADLSRSHGRWARLRAALSLRTFLRARA